MRAGFWLQHGSRDPEDLVAYSDDLASQPGGRPGIVLAPVNPTARLNALFEAARSKGDAFLDPGGHQLDGKHTQRAKKHFPWLSKTPRPASRQAWREWMEQSVEHQLSVELRGSGPGPSLVTTPSPIVCATKGQKELYEVLDAAAEVRNEHAPTHDLWLSLVVDRDYLREPQHRTRLGNAIVSSQVPGLIFRSFHTELPPCRNRAYIEGFREMTLAAYAGGVDLLLPHAGWLGWLAMTWGAWGFTGGLAAGSWGDREPGLPANSPDEPSNPYFEPQLLKTVRWRVHEELKQVPGYQACSCPECTAAGGNYEIARAKRHQIWWANEEAARLAPLDRSGRKQVAEGRLDAAIDFRDGLGAGLRDRVGADFLDVWRAAL